MYQLFDKLSQLGAAEPKITSWNCFLCSRPTFVRVRQARGRIGVLRCVSSQCAKQAPLFLQMFLLFVLNLLQYTSLARSGRASPFLFKCSHMSATSCFWIMLCCVSPAVVKVGKVAAEVAGATGVSLDSVGPQVVDQPYRQELDVDEADLERMERVLADFGATGQCSNETWEYDVDYWDNDLMNGQMMPPQPNAESCCEFCSNYPFAEGFVYHVTGGKAKSCWCKYKLDPAKKQATVAETGRVVGRVVSNSEDSDTCRPLFGVDYSTARDPCTTTKLDVLSCCKFCSEVPGAQGFTWHTGFAASNSLQCNLGCFCFTTFNESGPNTPTPHAVSGVIANPLPVDDSSNDWVLPVAIAVPVSVCLLAILGGIGVFVWWEFNKKLASQTHPVREFLLSTKWELYDAGTASNTSDGTSKGNRLKKPPLSSNYVSSVGEGWDGKDGVDCGHGLHGSSPPLSSLFLSSLLEEDQPQGSQNSNAKSMVINIDELHICKTDEGNLWKIGEGGCSAVYKGLHKGSQVALKFLKNISRKQMQLMLTEMAHNRMCQHPNIVKFIGASFGDGDQSVLVFELLEKGDLFTLLLNDDAREYSWYQKGQHVAADTARGLAYLHSKKLIHSDIKSPNIMLDVGDVAKIGDMGMAKYQDRTLVSKNGHCGTFAWAAPELLSDHHITEKVDIYSFGMLLWEIVTGKMPERGNYVQPKVPEECPQEICDLINSCRHPEPLARPSAAEVHNIIASCLFTEERIDSNSPVVAASSYRALQSV